jgi:hypothetical protein
MLAVFGPSHVQSENKRSADAQALKLFHAAKANTKIRPPHTSSKIESDASGFVKK